MKISCEEAARLMDRQDFEKLSSKEKFSLFFHNSYCKVCRVYYKISKRFAFFMKSERENPPCLSEKEKTALKKRLS